MDMKLNEKRIVNDIRLLSLDMINKYILICVKRNKF